MLVDRRTTPDRTLASDMPTLRSKRCCLHPSHLGHHDRSFAPRSRRARAPSLLRQSGQVGVAQHVNERADAEEHGADEEERRGGFLRALLKEKYASDDEEQAGAEVVDIISDLIAAPDLLVPVGVMSEARRVHLRREKSGMRGLSSGGVRKLMRGRRSDFIFIAHSIYDSHNPRAR